MNDKNEQRAKLLAETFHGEWESGPPMAFALEAAAAARRQRLVRRSVRTTATAAIIAIAAFVVLHRPATTPPPVVESAKPSAPARGYEILSDDELLAQVHDQALLVLKRADGSRQIFVLASGSE